MFERFTPEARNTVVLAQLQARDLGHGYIGTEHLLLSLLATDGKVKETVERMGVTEETVREEILGIVGRGEGAGPGHIPFTPRSKKVLELSLREALALKHDSITPEHILLGLLREGEGLAAQILFKRQVDLQGLRNEIVDQLPAAEAAAKRGFLRRTFRTPDPRVPPMTTGAARASDRAITRAAGAPVASQHYLLGLLDDESSLASKALGALGVSKADVEAKLAELTTKGTSDEPPEQWGGRNTSLEVEGDLVTVRVGDADLAARIRTQFEALKAEILRGPTLPGADKLWLAVHPAVEATVRRLEASTEPAEWDPLEWAKAEVATYSVLSRTAGPTARLWTADGVDRAEVRAFLAGWLARQAPGGDPTELAAYLSIAVSRAGIVVPDAADPDAFIVSHWSSGPGGPRFDRPRIPLGDLVAAALADLSEESAA